MIMVGGPAAGAAIYLRDITVGEEILVQPSAATGESSEVEIASETVTWSESEIWVDPVMNGDFVVYRLDRQTGLVTFATSLSYESEEE